MFYVLEFDLSCSKVLNVEISLDWALIIAYYRNEMEIAKGTEIYKQAPAKTMNIVYLMYHTMSPEMAIDRLKETYQSKHKKK